MVVVQAYVWVKLPVVVLVSIGLRVRVSIGVRVRVRLEAHVHVHVVVVLPVMGEVLVGVLGSTCCVLLTAYLLPLTTYDSFLTRSYSLATYHLLILRYSLPAR